MKHRKFFFNNLVLILVPFLVPLIILSAFSFYLTKNVISERFVEDTGNSIYQLANQFDYPFSDMDGLLQNFTSYPSTINYFRSMLNKETYSLDEIRSFNLVLSTLTSFLNYKPFFHSVYVYYDNPYGQFVSSANGIVKKDTFWDGDWLDVVDSLDPGNEYYAYVRNIRQAAFDTEGIQVITVIVRNMELSGCVVFNLRYSYFMDILSSMFSPKSDLVFITGVDESRCLISFPKETLLDLQTFSSSAGKNIPVDVEGTKYYCWKTSSRMGWTFYVFRSLDSVLLIPNTIMTVLILLVTVSAIVGTFIAIRVTKQNNRWIQEIIDLLEQSETLESIQPLKRRSDVYVSIVHNIIQVFLETKYLKAHQRSLELTALQAQINPHFLYNTLNAIYWESMSFGGGPNKVTDMVEKLSNILEYSVSDPLQMVSLEDEISYTKDYISILTYRFPDLFDVKWSVEPSVFPVMTMKLLFQPLVENAVSHGFKGLDRRGILRIAVSDTGTGELMLSVSDNGLGMDSGTLARMREKIDGDEKSEGIGFTNTVKRLRLLYGLAAQVRIDSKEGFGTTITIILPRLNSATIV